MTPRQQRFIHEYVVSSNGAQAAIRAGYTERSARVAAARLIANDNIRAEIDALRGKVIEKLDLTAESLVRNVIEIKRLAMLDGQFSAALKAIEMLGRVLANAGPQNPFSNEPSKLKHEFDEDMSSNDIARELAFALTLQMRRQQARDEAEADADTSTEEADVLRHPRQ